MQTKKIYCERGAWRDKLREFEKKGIIEIVSFPYEGKSRKTPKRSTPSLVTFDSTHLTWDMNILISDCNGSSKLDQIRKIIGRKNEMDARHIDSAYKSGCQAFLTPDKKDIISNKKELECLLNIKFFHPEDDWELIVEFINS